MFFSLWKHNVDLQLIGWDTTDAAYINFLFVVDSIKNFYIPAFNHFTLAGVAFAENLVTSNTFNIIDFTLALIAQLLPPIYVFQSQHTILGALSACFIYQACRRYRFDSIISLACAVSYSICLMRPVIGQGAFYFSFVILSFWIGPFQSLMTSKKLYIRIFTLLFALALMLKSYFFLVILFFCISILYTVYFSIKTRSNSLALLKPFFYLAILFLVYALPSFSYISNLTSDLVGNFVSPDPRIRSLVPPERFYYDGFLQLFLDLFDGRFHKNGKWTKGIGAIFSCLFLLRSLQILERKRITFGDALVYLIFILSILFALGVPPFRGIYESIPVLGSNRWGFGFIYFGQLATLLLGICALKDPLPMKKHLWIFFLPVLFFVFQYTKMSTWPTFFSIVGLFGFIYFYSKKPSFLSHWVLLSSLLLSFSSAREFEALPSEWSDVQKRQTNITYTQNKRNPGEPGEYKYWKRDWFYKKIPTMDGYNVAVHPIFWYLKSAPISSQIVIPLCDENIWQFRDRLNVEISDNAYLERSAQELTDLVEKYRCVSTTEVSDITLTPSSIKFGAVSPYSLILHNTQSFSWVTAPESERVLLGGIRLVKTDPGSFYELQFNKKKIYYYHIYAIMLAVGVLLYIYDKLGSAIERKLKLPKP